MKAVVIVLDSVGIGELPDAHLYGDEGSNTLVNIAKAVGGLNLPNLQKLGLGNIESIPGMPPVKNPEAAHGKMAEKSAGKDTTTGHWELMGVVLSKPFPLYPEGFPEDIIQRFCKEAGVRRVLANRPASGTEIIKELGVEHIFTGYPIVYTSADSVFQIASHKQVVPLDLLYNWCEVARRITDVGRVIARPFMGWLPSNFWRTHERHDYSLAPPEDTLLDILKDSGFQVVGVGKIYDIFAGKGLTDWVHTEDNLDGIKKTIEWSKKVKAGMVFTNLVDFDMKYGHRNDPEGYYRALQEFDRFVPDLINTLSEEDILVITADHGNDPTTPSTDHSREYVPVLIYGDRVKPVNIGVRKSFSDLGQTLAEFFGVGPLKNGESFASLIFKSG